MKQDPVTQATMGAVNRFNETFNRHDVDGVMAAMIDDCLFESTSPPSDGGRVRGVDVMRVRDGKAAGKRS